MGFVTAAQRFDVVSVGDVSTDVFIRLPEGQFDVRSDDSVSHQIGSQAGLLRETELTARLAEDGEGFAARSG